MRAPRLPSCRPSAVALALALGVSVGGSVSVGLVGCGKVEFVPSPFTPVDVELVYSPEEDLSRLRWRVADDTSLTFELARSDGSFGALEFAHAPYPSGSWACDGTCYQKVMRGQYRVPPGGVVVRSVHTDLGRFSGGPVDAHGIGGPPLTLGAELPDGNRTLALTLGDWLLAPGLERRFNLTTWSEPAGDCSAAHADAAVTVGPGSPSVPFVLPLTDDGRYCVRAHPVPLDGGPSLALAVPVLTSPEVHREELDYQPAAEVSPIVWRLVLDLEIVEKARCNQVASAVHDAFAAAFAATGAVAHELPAIDLAPGCQQTPNRAIDAAHVADDVKTWIATHYNEQYHRPVLLYVNNLDAPVPLSLISSLQLYDASFRDAHLRPFDLAFAARSASHTPGVRFDAAIEFIAIEDPNFTTTIADGAKHTLPFKSQLHMPDEIVQLMPPDVLSASLGLPWKLCEASPAIARLAGTTPIADDNLTPVVDALAPPAFRVALPVKVLVPGPLFQPDTVVIRYELCRRWCGHPFRDEPMTLHPEGWTYARACVRNELP